jgi:flagella basal body P-ring formation protein FlgA
MILTTALLLLATWPEPPRAATGLPAREAIARAIVARAGADAVVSITSVDLGSRKEADAYREARPDPSARIGGAMKFRLITDNGASHRAIVHATISAPQVVTVRPVARGHAVEQEDVRLVHGPVSGIPLVRLPAIATVVGARALRPIPAGIVILASYVAARRTVEPGDDVTVVALAGSVQVTATFVAADAGNVGDTIRARNPLSRRFVRGRVIVSGPPAVLEVIHER